MVRAFDTSGALVAVRRPQQEGHVAFCRNEAGTVSEYLLNVWHWDGMLLLLMIAALPCLITGVLLLRNGRVHTEHENGA